MTQTITVKMDKDSEYYFVDASASDQGAVDASYDSAKDLIDAIGTSKSATLVFSHSGGGNTTTYTFSTSETIPDNFDVVVESGAIIVVATGITVTCNATFNASLQQCFSLTGTGKWAFGIGAVDKVYPQWWGALADDSNDDTAEIQAAADSITYGIVFFMGGTYKITTQIEITTKKVLSGADRATTFIKLYTAAQHGIYINTDGQVTVENLSITAGITKGAGAGIYVTDSSTNNGWSLFNNLQLVAQYIGIDLLKPHYGLCAIVILLTL